MGAGCAACGRVRIRRAGTDCAARNDDVRRRSRCLGVGAGGLVEDLRSGDNAWVETERTDYDATTALPVRQYAFGALQQTLAHHADGTLASISDARDSTTFDTTVH
jgi:hypothetical protein